MSIDAKSKRLAIGLSVGFILMGSLAGCDSFTVSDEAKEQGMETICNGSQTAIKQLDTGDDAAKLAAIMIRDNVEDSKIKSIASKVADGNGTKAEREELIKWIKSECG